MNINNAKVQEKIKDHIIEYFEDREYKGIDSKDNVSKIKKEIDSAIFGHRGVKFGAERFIEGGGFLVNNYDVIEFLDSLDLKTDRYLDDPFEYYTMQVADIMTKIYKGKI